MGKLGDLQGFDGEREAGKAGSITAQKLHAILVWDAWPRLLNPALLTGLKKRLF